MRLLYPRTVFVTFFVLGAMLSFAPRTFAVDVVPFVPGREGETPDECVDRLWDRVKALPVQKTLKTLDGGEVTFSDFPDILPEKFYHWESEVKMVTATSRDGRSGRTTTRKVRMYWNLGSSCGIHHSSKNDPHAIYGDVGELYAEDGTFLAFVVYRGGGDYLVPLNPRSLLFAKPSKKVRV